MTDGYKPSVKYATKPNTTSVMEHLEFLEAVREIHPSIRICAFVRRFNVLMCDSFLWAIMNSMEAVIPGEDTWDCQACGICCTKEGGVPHPAETKWTEDGRCINLRKDNKCGIDKGKPAYCRLYPFRVVNFEKGPSLLFVDIRCRGRGRGRVIDEKRYEELVKRTKGSEQVRD
jgi:Fe-S-cluster containining protein